MKFSVAYQEDLSLNTMIVSIFLKIENGKKPFPTCVKNDFQTFSNKLYHL